MTTPSVELLRFQPQSQRTTNWFGRLTQTAARGGVDMAVTDVYQGAASWLMLWGPGAPDRQGPMVRQLATGGHVVCWDLAYWQRETKLRCSIDAPHPQAWVMRRTWPTDRLRADGIVPTETWDPDGPVIIAGLGQKARVQYGAGHVDGWEAAMARVAIQRGRTVWYRPKRDDGTVPEGTWRAPTGPIETVLPGASLVITWHSNVAVDAIRAGIPVICCDGAAAAVCDSAFPADTMPRPLLPGLRDHFLANLAFFQWGPTETMPMWAFLRELLA